MEEHVIYLTNIWIENNSTHHFAAASDRQELFLLSSVVALHTSWTQTKFGVGSAVLIHATENNNRKCARRVDKYLTLNIAQTARIQTCCQ
jgi:hypothetical protein